jgi:HlyD family secretion protein
LRAVSNGGSGAQRASATAALAQAQLDRARVDLARTEIHAPADGTLLARYVEPGDLVSPGSQLLTLSTKGDTRVVIEPDERSLAFIQLGQHARVSTEAFPNQVFDATVAYIAPSVNPKRGTIEVRLNVAKPPAYLRPDMTVSTEVSVGQEAQALVVPTPAVYSRLNAPWLYVIQEGRVHKRSIELGVTDVQNSQIKSGVAAGEIVVLDSVALKDGQRVRPLGDPAP